MLNSGNSLNEVLTTFSAKTAYYENLVMAEKNLMDSMKAMIRYYPDIYSKFTRD